MITVLIVVEIKRKGLSYTIIFYEMRKDICICFQGIVLSSLYDQFSFHIFFLATLAGFTKFIVQQTL